MNSAWLITFTSVPTFVLLSSRISKELTPFLLLWPFSWNLLKRSVDPARGFPCCCLHSCILVLKELIATNRLTANSLGVGLYVFILHLRNMMDVGLGDNHPLTGSHAVCNDLTRFNKIATQGAPQMAVDKEANSLSRVYSYYSKFNLRLFYV